MSVEFCMNCDNILNKKASITKNILKKNNIATDDIGKILKYIDYKIKALHDDHYICSDCISYLYYVANIQDTMMTKCPICPRVIFIGNNILKL